jgi:hypothetical protein
LLLVKPFRQVDTQKRGAGHKSASWSDFDATAWGMQFGTLNAYPSAVPVPKEIFADVLHALPLAASITILAESTVLLGFFKLLQHTARILLKCALWMRPESPALRGVMWRWCSARPAELAGRGLS